ncbi:SBBP repeat-containing protein [Leptolyngbya sp. 7M]|uniref:SBBP repeat-containing protein n=1 Tax=Leptolyngbya sp. 7M TaxID=2812896 RepID=UPI001B8D0400|nr:SBBP repeat-containing protein [Leptolyngbya sp. 7M]QYO67170.1 SBBP repeat-containing protein [Leptolyngbya sp. 7M]
MVFLVPAFFLNALRLELKGIKSFLYVSVFPKWNLRVPELIGIVFADTPLSLTASYFEYDNTPPQPGVINNQVRQFGTPGVDLAFGTAADTFGNGFLSGATTGALAGPNQGSYDAWIAKYDGNGNRSWIRQLGTPQQDVATRVATDSLGNSYVTGFTLGNLGGQNAGLEDGFLAKYSPSGDLLWVRQYGTASLDNSLDVAVDRSSNSVYVTGFTIGALGGPNASPIPVTDDSYIAKFDSNGNVVWIRQFGTTAFDEAYSVTTDQQGNVFATGWTQGNLGGTNAGLYDIWLTKYDSAGNRQWIRQFGTPEYEFPWKAVVDGENNVYVTGWTLGRLGSNSFGSYDAFLAKYDNNGNRIWIKQFGTAGDDAAFGLSVDSSNNLFVAGFTDRSFGGTNAGQEDAWYAKFDKNGNQLWVKQFGSPDIDRARGGIAVNNQGKIFVSGLTEGVLGGPNARSFDAFLLIDQDTNSASPARTTATRAAQLAGRDPVSGIQNGSPLTGSSVNQTIQAVKQNIASSRSQAIGTANSFLTAAGFLPSTQNIVSGLLGQQNNHSPLGLDINSFVPALSTQPFAANAL